AFLLQAAAEATRGQATSRAHDLRAGSALAQSGPSPLPPARADQGLDAAQRAALPPASSQAPTVR
ncbi:MAG TPA: hypothetical protein VN520_25260, partial [Streptomyces sp.]|uniref:hypothetical protein n=1 Tax=Streptomyces sp. TaxID=1931 RepID=UPI002C122B21|nr:hypothetical protein [Streptomyces sp.]